MILKCRFLEAPNRMACYNRFIHLIVFFFSLFSFRKVQLHNPVEGISLNRKQLELFIIQVNIKPIHLLNRNRLESKRNNIIYVMFINANKSLSQN